MSRKHIAQKFNVIESGDLSGSLTSVITDCEQMDRISYTGVWSGTGVGGEIKVFKSDDKVNWSQIPMSDTLLLSGTSGDFFLECTEVNFKYVKLTYTFSAGTGSLTVSYHANTVGA